jgi:hypothetical protein
LVLERVLDFTPGIGSGFRLLPVGPYLTEGEARAAAACAIAANEEIDG